MSFYRVRLHDIFNGEITLMEAADLVSQIPMDKSSAVFREVVGDDYRWGLPEQLMAGVFDLLNILRWFETKDATKRSPKHRPEPLERPGLRKSDNKIKNRFMSESVALPVDEVEHLLSLPRTSSNEKPIRSGSA